MPELPEVETIVRGLAASITGQDVGRVIVARADVVHGNGTPLTALLPGRRVSAVSRRGKRILVRCDESVELMFHLGMSGQLTLTPTAQGIEPHTHVRIGLDDNRSELRFRDPRRFGGVWVIDRQGPVDGALSPLGIEPLGASLARFSAVLGRRRQIKSLLLDQQTIAGIGNIYCDEILHRAGIHPLTPGCTLGDDTVRRLWNQMRRTLGAAIRAGGSSISDYRDASGRPGRYQRQHRVYGRAGRPCHRCQTPIVRTVVAGRGTHICPKCQPVPATVADGARRKKVSG